MSPVSRHLRLGIILTLGLAGLLWLLFLVRGVLLPFAAGLFLVYLTEPVVEQMERRQVPRLVALIVIYAGLAAVVWVSIVYLWPILAAETNRILRSVPERAAELRILAQRLLSSGRNQRLPALASATLTGLAAELQRWAAQAGRYVVVATLSLFSKAALLLLAPVIAFYASHDLPRWRRRVLALWPATGREELRALFHEVNAVLGGYLRGQLLISCFVGLGTWAGLALLGIPYSLLIGLVAGITDIIPYFGPLIGLVPAAVLGFARSTLTGVYVIVLFFVIHQVEGGVLVPRIMGHRVGLHPLVVIFVLLAGGQLFGVVGMVLGVPAAAVARVLLAHAARWLFGERATAPD
ncbi:MAG: AI-2E family transporter [Chitinophagales bacterium]